MNKDQALTRAFQLAETLDLTGLSALQLVQTVNVIAEELQEVFAEGRADKVKEGEGWKGLGANVRRDPSIKDPEEILRATWKEDEVTAKLDDALKATVEGPRLHLEQAPVHKYKRDFEEFGQ